MVEAIPSPLEDQATSKVVGRMEFRLRRGLPLLAIMMIGREVRPDQKISCFSSPPASIKIKKATHDEHHLETQSYEEIEESTKINVLKILLWGWGGGGGGFLSSDLQI